MTGRSGRLRRDYGPLVTAGGADLDTTVLQLLDGSGRNVEAAARVLRDLLREYPERAGLAAQLKALEHEGDRLTHDIICRLRSLGGRSALEIADGHALAGALDDIVDHAEQTGDWLGLYAVEAPMTQADELADVLVDATGCVRRTLEALRAGRDPTAYLAEINRLEDEGDRIYRDAVASLFAFGIDPMVVIRWKDIFESLERAVDACETVAHVVEGMVLRRPR